MQQPLLLLLPLPPLLLLLHDHDPLAAVWPLILVLGRRRRRQ